MISPSEQDNADIILDSDRVIGIVADILSVSPQKAKAEYDPKSTEFGDVQNVFCNLSGTKYKQEDSKKVQALQWPRWVAALLPEKNLEADEINPYSTLKFSKNDYLAESRVYDQADLRYQFVKGLYEITPADERESYRTFLEPKDIDGLLNKDAGITETINEIEGLFITRYAKVEELLLNNPSYVDQGKPLSPWRVIDLSVTVAEEILWQIEEILKQHPCDKKDSLAARLILNSAVNCAILGLDELKRQHQEALQAMESVVSLLRDVLPPGSIYGCSIDNISEYLAYIFDTLEVYGKELHGDGFSFTLNVRGIIVSKAIFLLDQFCQHRSNGRFQEFIEIHGNPHNLLLMATCLAWAYTRKEEHDLRIVGLKNRAKSILHSRSKIDQLDMPASMISYLLGQYGLLYYSNQHIERSFSNLKDYSTAADAKRLVLRDLLINLKPLSLSQWQALNVALPKIPQEIEWYPKEKE